MCLRCWVGSERGVEGSADSVPLYLTYIGDSILNFAAEQPMSPSNSCRLQAFHGELFALLLLPAAGVVLKGEPLLRRPSLTNAGEHRFRNRLRSNPRPRVMFGGCAKSMASLLCGCFGGGGWCCWVGRGKLRNPSSKRAGPRRHAYHILHHKEQAMQEHSELSSLCGCYETSLAFIARRLRMRTLSSLQRGGRSP